MTACRFVLPAALLVALLLAPAAVSADETTPYVRAPILQGAAMELLPFDEFKRQDFNKKHGPLVYRIQILGRQIKKLRGQLGKRKNKRDAQSRKLNEEIRRLSIQTTALRMRLTEEIQAAGVSGALISYMNHAPTGKGRHERYSHGLVLLADGLTPAQRSLFERIHAQIEGAYHVMTAQRERALLSLKQTKLDKSELGAVRRTFDRQLQVIDKRFWLLVDLVLDRDTKVEIWNNLPQRMRRKSQAIEHLYQLPGLTPSQATRIRSVQTELEHEASPDQAAIKRLSTEMRKKGLTGAERQKLNRERGEVYRRLSELRRATAKATKQILTEEQFLAYQAIPPRISTNERAGNYNRIFRGFKPNAAQSRKINALQKTYRDRRRAASRRIAEIRRKGADYGPDSPQMMSMQMEMTGARAESAAYAREFARAMFLDVLTPDQVTHWVMGNWGYKN